MLHHKIKNEWCILPLDWTPTSVDLLLNNLPLETTVKNIHIVIRNIHSTHIWSNSCDKHCFLCKKNLEFHYSTGMISYLHVLYKIFNIVIWLTLENCWLQKCQQMTFLKLLNEKCSGLKLVSSQLLIFTIPVLEIWTHYFQLSEAPYISYGENYLD